MTHEAFAVTAPGLAPLCEAELHALGIHDTQADDAGVAFSADATALARAHLWLATASRIIVRLASFEARGFAELERHAKRVPWGRVVAPGRAVRLRVTSRKSKLYHTAAIAERLWPAIVAAGGVAPVSSDMSTELDDLDAPDDGLSATDDAQLIIVRVLRDVVTISADASGALLHRRGWRLATAKAPMRETLAAALLRAAGYDGTGPLVDPVAGSGTLGIEGARLARRMPPGLDRTFGFERWPAFDPKPLAHARADAEAHMLSRAPAPIVVNDRDAGAVDAITANATRAGVLADLDIRHGPATRVLLPKGPGWLVANPPYGKRVTGGDDPRDLYISLGRAWRAGAAGWRVGVVTTTAALANAFGLPLRATISTRNGGLAVAFYTGLVPSSSQESSR